MSDDIQVKKATNSEEVAKYPWLASYPEGVDWHQKFIDAPLYQLLDEAVERFPDNICTNFLGRTMTYSDIGQQVNQIAGALQRLGFQRGTKVGLFLPNCPTFIIYYYAILKAGGVVVNYNPLYTIEELSFQIKDSETKFMVTLDLKVLFDKVEQLLANNVLERAIVASFPALLPGAKSVLFKMLKGKELAHPGRSAQASKVVLACDLPIEDGRHRHITIDPVTEVAVLQYTGGTTGTPKGAMLTHSNVRINALQVSSWAPSLEDGVEKVFGALPFFHVFAMTVVMNYGIAKGAELIIMPRFVLNDALKLIDKTKPTVMPGVPTLFNAMLNHPKLKKFDLSTLKFCLSGGAPLPLEVKEQFEKVTGCKVVEGYGLSETSPVVTCNPLYGKAKKGSIGMPVPATYVSLRDLEDPSKEVPHGEKGELCVKGPQVMLGYWGRPEETAHVFVGDYLRTGDVARMDEDGMFSIEDRIKDLIICSGYNVYPRRIEEAFYTHVAVEEVIVIGIKDSYRGEAPKAFVKLKESNAATAEELMAHLAQKLSKIELPEVIEFRDELPKTMIGKLSKKELKAEEDAKSGSA